MTPNTRSNEAKIEEFFADDGPMLWLRLKTWWNEPVRERWETNRLKGLIYLISSAIFRRPVQYISSIKFLRLFYYRTALPKNAILCVQTDLGSFNVNTSDSVIGAETFIHRKAYDGQKLQLACSLLPANHTKELLIDVGANIGTICISAVKSQLFRRAVAFDPEPNNF